MNPIIFFQLISRISPWFIAKILILILIFLYILLAGIIVRQVQLMTQVVEANFSSIIKLIALIHLITVVFIFLLALFVL